MEPFLFIAKTPGRVYNRYIYPILVRIFEMASLLSIGKQNAVGVVASVGVLFILLQILCPTATLSIQSIPVWIAGSVMILLGFAMSIESKRYYLKLGKGPKGLIIEIPKNEYEGLTSYRHIDPNSTTALHSILKQAGFKGEFEVDFERRIIIVVA